MMSAKFERIPSASLLKMMLNDAVKWQESLADACKGTSDFEEADDLLNQYRKLLKRRYGSGRTVSEQAMDGMTNVTLEEIRKRHE